MKRNYYLGLDIGTNSVGWAVTDENYNICNAKNKALWGIRLFESANTAEERRLHRCSRRRLNRRKQRINLLQEIFSEEISKVDETFFIRLNESRLHIEDKSVKNKFPLFIDKEYSDIEYYKEYPTIFHLRKELISNRKKHDIRLIYLALHNIIKYRGHFLIDGDLAATKNFKIAFNNMLEILTNELNVPFEVLEDDRIIFEELLKNKTIRKSDKSKRLASLFYIDKDDYSKEELKNHKSIVGEVSKLLVGNKGDFSKILGIAKEDIQYKSFTFADPKYDEEIRAQLEDDMPDKAYILDYIKVIYDWSILTDILGDEAYISFAKVNQYNMHKTNLEKIRRMLLKYCDKSIYNNFFNNQAAKVSYTNYIGSVKKNGTKYNAKKTTEDEFYKELIKILESIKPEAIDEDIIADLLEGATLKTLMPLQRNKNNGTVPHQVHELELQTILDNAAKYISFLNYKDEKGISNIDKILSIFRYRVPYYVGPLGVNNLSENANSWMIRKAGNKEKIYPWNINDVVDMEASNEAFIRRMTNKCTYLLGKDVIPKNSLLYSKFMVLNELNNLKIHQKGISVAAKQSIFNDLFKTKTKVTGKGLLQYLKQELPDLKIEDLSGFDKDFHTSLKSYLDFKKQIFGDDIDAPEIENIAEDIIRWITIYGDDSKMVKRMIDKVYPDRFSEEQYKKISKLRYKGWANFSKEFLTDINGINKSTGEQLSIIDALWTTNDNLMQLLDKRYSFMEEIYKCNADQQEKIEHITYDTVVKDLVVSPANKRAIWQTVQIAEEIKKIMGCPPKKIFVEMARGGEKEKTRKDSRKDKLMKLYDSCKDESRHWLKELESKEERDFNSMKLFLYYTQMGKCMYTGREIDIDSLMMGNSRWDRDHIYPQSKIKDDSIDNLVLVDKTFNAKKSNEILSSDIQGKMNPFWLSLLKNGFISKKKYDRLMKSGEFSEDELTGFISRQLVETRQSSKAVANIFKQIYDESEVIYVKAGLVSDFRKNQLHYLKSRRVNDYHHAKDAYLNIVVGNVYNAKFTSNPIQWMKKNRSSNYSINKVFCYDVYREDALVWKGLEKDDNNKFINNTGTIADIRKIVKNDNILYTEYTYCDKGELFDATIKNKDAGAKIKIKSNLDTEKYGGYNGASTSYFSLIEFDGKNGERIRNIVGVPIYISNVLHHNPNAFMQYCEEILNIQNVTILFPMIKKNSLITVDGFPMRIRGENRNNLMFKCNLQLKTTKNIEELIRKIEKYLSKNDKYKFNERLDGITEAEMKILFDYFLEKMNTVYERRPANQYEKIGVKSEIFAQLDSAKRLYVLDQMLNLLRCDINTQANLTDIECSSNGGKMDVNKNTIGKAKLVLVNQSCTGLFENRIKL